MTALEIIARVSRDHFGDPVGPPFGATCCTPSHKPSRKIFLNFLPSYLSLISVHSRFFVIALMFFYGARLVSMLEFSNFEFFVGLMVRVCNCELYTTILMGDFTRFRALSLAPFKQALCLHMFLTSHLPNMQVPM